MKLKDVKTNQEFETHSGVVLRKIAMTKAEIKLHKSDLKVIRVDNDEIYFLPENFFSVRIKK